jgi:hypothetical protein
MVDADLAVREEAAPALRVLRAGPLEVLGDEHPLRMRLAGPLLRRRLDRPGQVAGDLRDLLLEAHPLDGVPAAVLEVDARLPHHFGPAQIHQPDLADAALLPGHRVGLVGADGLVEVRHHEPFALDQRVRDGLRRRPPDPDLVVQVRGDLLREPGGGHVVAVVRRRRDLVAGDALRRSADLRFDDRARSSCRCCGSGSSASTATRPRPSRGLDAELAGAVQVPVVVALEELLEQGPLELALFHRGPAADDAPVDVGGEDRRPLPGRRSHAVEETHSATMPRLRSSACCMRSISRICCRTWSSDATAASCSVRGLPSGTGWSRYACSTTACCGAWMRCRRI